MRIAVISGHYIEDLLEKPEKIEIGTRYGDVEVIIGRLEDREIIFLNRHGISSKLPPHRINYLANIEALKIANVDTIISIGTVGSLNPNIKPGYIAIPHDFIDFTKNRTYTFFDDSRTHVDMSEPFCPYLRKILIDTCKEHSVDFYGRAVYLVTEGPRLETKSEIRFFSNHADVVGMTLVPEVVLAREKEMCYASLTIVCNMAAGLQGKLSAEEIKIFFNEKKKILAQLVKEALMRIEEKRDCRCRESLKEATL
ncbi:MAG: MTAP family purine nucleoside phosphorylase [Thermoplasmata archaeon]|nr:MTAP family purine nucleoside phosphorylase [Thermoplasmata archaeon]